VLTRVQYIIGFRKYRRRLLLLF